jgi:hypothetical protein
MSRSELIFKFLKVNESFIKVLDIIYLVKLLEQSLPAQNTVQLRVPCRGFKFSVCDSQRTLLGEVGQGNSRKRVGS